MNQLRGADEWNSRPDLTQTLFRASNSASGDDHDQQSHTRTLCGRQGRTGIMTGGVKGGVERREEQVEEEAEIGAEKRGRRRAKNGWNEWGGELTEKKRRRVEGDERREERRGEERAALRH